MKQFLLFAGSHYYPGGGWEDFRGDFKSVGAALAAALLPHDDYVNGHCDWYQIVDIQKGECVQARTRKYVLNGGEWFDPSGKAEDEVNFTEELRKL